MVKIKNWACPVLLSKERRLMNNPTPERVSASFFGHYYPNIIFIVTVFSIITIILIVVLRKPLDQAS